jgi:hypothetical protein
VLSVSGVSSTVPRYSTGARPSSTPADNFHPAYVPPEVAEARAFEERLRYAERHGSFLALTVKMNLYKQARHELTTRFATRPLDLERVFLEALRQAADEVGADWSVVVGADAADHRSEDWRNLNHLIASSVIPQVEQALLNAGSDVQNSKLAGRPHSDGESVSPPILNSVRLSPTVLTYHLNWLERYGQVVMLSRLAQAVQDGRLHGAWLLIPASPPIEMPLLDGAAVPVITSNQWAYIPQSWIQNLHRSGAKNNGNCPPPVALGATEGS